MPSFSFTPHTRARALEIFISLPNRSHKVETERALSIDAFESKFVHIFVSQNARAVAR